jgi:hypothetical protein
MFHPRGLASLARHSGRYSDFYPADVTRYSPGSIEKTVPDSPAAIHAQSFPRSEALRSA